MSDDRWMLLVDDVMVLVWGKWACMRVCACVDASVERSVRNVEIYRFLYVPFLSFSFFSGVERNFEITFVGIAPSIVNPES